MKVCKTCKVTKTLDQFSAGRRACKTCRAAVAKAEYQGWSLPGPAAPQPVDMKQCRLCGITKPFSLYSRQVTVRDGLSATCKPCRSARDATYLRALDDERRELRLVQMATWRALNPDKAEQNSLRRRKVLKAAMVNPHVTKVWLRRRDGDNCHYCGIALKFDDKGMSDASAHLEHKVPVSKGGLHSESNCVLSCRKCNLTKGTKVLA